MEKGRKDRTAKFKKPKKTGAEHAKVAATVPVIGSLGKSAKDGQTRR